jgi:hypothetical protein
LRCRFSSASDRRHEFFSARCRGDAHSAGLGAVKSSAMLPGDGLSAGRSESGALVIGERMSDVDIRKAVRAVARADAKLFRKPHPTTRIRAAIKAAAKAGDLTRLALLRLALRDGVAIRATRRVYAATHAGARRRWLSGPT